MLLRSRSLQASASESEEGLEETHGWNEPEDTPLKIIRY